MKAALKTYILLRWYIEWMLRPFSFYVKSNRALENLPTGEDANANPISQMPGGNFNFQGFNPTNMPKVEYALASTSGELEIQPYKGGSELKLAFKIEMKGQKLDLKDRQSLGREVRVSVRSEPVVKVELTPSAKYTFLNGKCRIDLPPFRVEDHTPQEDAYNINPENPCFQVQFSDAVDLAYTQ